MAAPLRKGEQSVQFSFHHFPLTIEAAPPLGTLI
jgi:hypothetical protein